MKKAFTLIEVNLAMLIMAGGILTIVGLYAFGFRENAQSREDVAGAALADSVMSPLIMAISSPDVKWSSFDDEFTFPSEGWKSYHNSDWSVKTDTSSSTAKGVFQNVMSKMSGAKVNTSFPSTELSASGLACALVVHHEKNSGTVSIAFRAVQKNNMSMLMAQPLYFTEVRFQGANP